MESRAYRVGAYRFRERERVTVGIYVTPYDNVMLGCNGWASFDRKARILMTGVLTLPGSIGGSCQDQSPGARIRNPNISPDM